MDHAAQRKMLAELESESEECDRAGIDEPGSHTYATFNSPSSVPPAHAQGALPNYEAKSQYNSYHRLAIGD